MTVTKQPRRHACNRCRTHKPRCERSRGNLDVCDRCVRSRLTCVSSPTLPMGRLRSIHTKHRYSRKSYEKQSNID
ncbi:hypothetical protein BO71DRAFT_113313 [Aspergillus ellipticus CBS 707.79]|uniref:Zn(2)-C6 fungal-type domain-containing protein n=1 Tax=Aspergillus ellipticus CBS 707.79 TaxID=1448320 RepID=A0A319DM84_9EURO|nr:hypothetical protein BO71DRAFT_113313 [Aspergillus ellipticus CBS 707.79]